MFNTNSHFRYRFIAIFLRFGQFSSSRLFLWMENRRIPSVETLKTAILPRHASLRKFFSITRFIRRLFIVLFPFACDAWKNDLAQNIYEENIFDSMQFLLPAEIQLLQIPVFGTDNRALGSVIRKKISLKI